MMRLFIPMYGMELNPVLYVEIFLSTLTSFSKIAFIVTPPYFTSTPPNISIARLRTSRAVLVSNAPRNA